MVRLEDTSDAGIEIVIVEIMGHHIIVILDSLKVNTDQI
jgi:hypothetical protein